MSSSLGFRPHPTSFLGRFTEYKLIFLFCGLALWLFVPIIGIFPLLFFVQLNILSKPQVAKNKVAKAKILTFNNFILLLIVLTLTIFVSSFEVFSDTLTYIQDYSNLDETGWFGIKKYGSGWEFMTFLLAYPTFLLSNGSEYWFLFNYALIINLLVVFVASRSLSSKYYPLILIFVFSTNLYYGQVLYMRHFLSNVFLLIAIASLNQKRYIVSAICSVFSHLSNLLFILVTLTFVLNNHWINFLQKLQRQKLLFNALLISIFVAAVIIFRVYGSETIINLINPLIDFNQNSSGKEVGNYLQNRISNYDGRLQEVEYSFPIMAIIDTVIVGVIILFRDFTKASKSVLCLVGVYWIYLLAFLFVALTGFNWRICLLFFSFSGFFYWLGLELKHRDVQLSMLALAGFKVFYFIFWLYKMDSKSYLVFFDAQPLATTIYDYIVFFLDSIIT